MDGEACLDPDSATCREGAKRTGAAIGSSRAALDPAVARRMQAVLRAWCAQARGGGAFLGGLEAGKTGPTNESRDLLFIGYEPSRKWVMGIWLGNDDNSPTRSSSALAASLWASIIREAGHGSGGAG